MPTEHKAKVFSIKIQKINTRLSPHLLDLKPKKEVFLNSKPPKQSVQFLFRDKVQDYTGRLLTSLPKLQTKSQNLLKTCLNTLPQTPHKQSFNKTRLLKHTPIKHVKKTPPSFANFFKHLQPLLTHHYSLPSLLALLLIIFIPMQTIGAYERAKSADLKLRNETQELQQNLNSLQEAFQSGDLNQVKTDLQDLQTNFQEINQTTGSFWPLTLYPPVHAMRSLLNDGVEMVGSTLNILEETERIKKNERDLASSLYLIQKETQTILKNIKSAQKQVNKLDTPLFPKGKKYYQVLKPALKTLQKDGEYLSDALELLPEILGIQTPKKYLFIFQNNNELRPTGGFAGSFAVMEINQGQIKKWEIPGGGTYDLQGSAVSRLVAPQPLWLLNPRFEFQDLNWFPDFPTSAKKILTFYEQAGGQTVDGTMAVTASFVEDLLKIIGPITVTSFNKTITDDNFIIETQKAVELEYNKKQNRPKQFLGALFPAIVDRLQNASDKELSQIIGLLLKSFSQKDIQLYLADPSIETKIQAINWGGHLKETPGDYLMLVSANLGGNKTDGVIKQEIAKEIFFTSEGQMINRVKITRTHAGQEGDIWTGKGNTSFLRLYVPKGSKLLYTDGFEAPSDYLFKKPTLDLKPDPDVRAAEMTMEKTSDGTLIMEEADKTVFANWSKIKPGETKEIILTYSLPDNLKITKPGLYSLLVQKQAGRNDDIFKLSIQGAIAEKDKIDLDALTTIGQPLDSDKFFSFIIQ